MHGSDVADSLLGMSPRFFLYSQLNKGVTTREIAEQCAAEMKKSVCVRREEEYPYE
jgi:hypothetical protein